MTIRDFRIACKPPCARELSRLSRRAQRKKGRSSQNRTLRPTRHPSTSFPAPAPLADFGDVLRVLRLQEPAALQNLQRVFFVGKPQLLRALLPQKHDRGAAACERLL